MAARENPCPHQWRFGSADCKSVWCSGLQSMICAGFGISGCESEPHTPPVPGEMVDLSAVLGEAGSVIDGLEPSLRAAVGVSMGLAAIRLVTDALGGEDLRIEPDQTLVDMVLAIYSESCELRYIVESAVNEGRTVSRACLLSCLTSIQDQADAACDTLAAFDE